MSKKLSSFSYGDFALTQTVLIDDVPHITRQGIGEWLLYADPQKQIDKIIERNPHLETYSVPVKLTATDGKNYETNVYHPIGFLLIVMESGQPKAKEKKVEVAEFVWHFSNPGTERLSPKERRLIRGRITMLVAKMHKTTDAMALQEVWAEVKDLCDVVGRDHPNLALLGKDFKQSNLPGFNAPQLT